MECVVFAKPFYFMMEPAYLARCWTFHHVRSLHMQLFSQTMYDWCCRYGHKATESGWLNLVGNWATLLVFALDFKGVGRKYSHTHKHEVIHTWHMLNGFASASKINQQTNMQTPNCFRYEYWEIADLLEFVLSLCWFLSCIWWSGVNTCEFQWFRARFDQSKAIWYASNRTQVRTTNSFLSRRRIAVSCCYLSKNHSFTQCNAIKLPFSVGFIPFSLSSRWKWHFRCWLSNWRHWVGRRAFASF